MCGPSSSSFGVSLCPVSYTHLLLTMLIVVPVELIVLGPIGTQLSGAVGNFCVWLGDTLGFVSSPILAAVYPYMVMLGMDKAMAPISLELIATVGYNSVTGSMGFISNLCIGATALAVALSLIHILMDIRADNLYAFKNFHMNMSYPKKIVNSYIPDENLEGRPNFRYKKINILMGANASGKTTIGKLMMAIFNFMDKKEFDRVVDVISKKEEKASFSIDFVEMCIRDSRNINRKIQIHRDVVKGKEGEYGV